MKQIRINGDDRITVNTNADTKGIKEVIKASLWAGAGIWALTKGIKHYFEAGRNAWMCDMIDMINVDLSRDKVDAWTDV